MSANENDITCIVNGYDSNEETGVLYAALKNKQGEVIGEESIANFTPVLTERLIKDDGFTTVEELEFSPYKNGHYGTPVRVTKKVITGSQPDSEFGAEYYYYLMVRGAKTHFANFMLSQCGEAEKSMLYTHTGWITSDKGKRVYLNGDYSVDENGLTDEYRVELDNGFEGFKFIPVEDEVSECFKTVTQEYSTVAPDWVTVPLLSYAFMTPLNEMLKSLGHEPRFTLYVIGKTGSFKTSLVKLLLCFFGSFNYGDPSPVSFEDTVNAFKRKFAIGADLPLLLDDRKPSMSLRDRSKYEERENEAINTIGDRTIKGRANVDGTLRKGFVPKCNLLITAEEAYTNVSPSTIARAISLEWEPDTVKFHVLEDLQDKSTHFNKVMQLYIQWLIVHYDSIKGRCVDALRAFRESYIAAGHNRLATTFSQLQFGYAVYLAFLKDYRIIDNQTAEQMMERATDIFIQMCEKQSAKMESEKPTILFSEILREMLAIGQVTLADLRKTQTIKDIHINAPVLRSNSIGYRDDNYIYLIPYKAYNEVCQFYSQTGNVFPSSKAALWKAFLEEGKIQPTINDGKIARLDKAKKIAGKTSKFIWLNASVIDDIEGGENDE